MGAMGKGCGTCKRRKVKCDETHPKCTRCHAAGIECTGFARRLRFVDENPRIKRKEGVIHAQSHEFSTKAGSGHLSSHSSKICSHQLLIPVPFLADSLPLTAFKDDISISFLVSKFFETEHPHFAERYSCGLPIEWIYELIKTPQKPRLKSWDALATIVYGQANRSHDLIRSALGLYAQALSELRMQLSDPHIRQSHSVLASITALYMYQIIVSKTENLWMLHVDGLGGILRWRGPRLQKSYATKRIFLEHRITLVAKAIISGQRTFLRQPVWRTLPWEDDIASKLAMDYLVDIGADIAEYLAQVKTLTEVGANQKLTWKLLRTQVAMSLGELNIWWCKWEAEHPHAVTAVSSCQLINDPILPTLLKYDLLETSFEVCLYNTMRILLLQLWHTLQLFPNATPNTDPTVVLNMSNKTVLLGITSDVTGLAREIIQSLRYCYGKSRRFLFTFSFLFIQEVAYGCFDKDSKEAQYVVSQDWAELISLDDFQDANLLKRLLPQGKIKLVSSIRHN